MSRKAPWVRIPPSPPVRVFQIRASFLASLGAQVVELGSKGARHKLGQDGLVQAFYTPVGLWPADPGAPMLEVDIAQRFRQLQLAELLARDSLFCRDARGAWLPAGQSNINPDPLGKILWRTFHARNTS